MKILCVIDSLRPGGAQRQLVELAKGFKEKGHVVSFLTYHDLNFFKPQLDELNIPMQTILEHNYIKRLLKMRRAIRKLNPDAVLSFLEGSNFIATCSGLPTRKWRLIVGERSANPQILNSFKLRFFRLLHFFADVVVSNSQANMDIVRKVNPLLKTKKCKVIYNFTSMQIETEQNTNLKKKNKTIVTIAASYRKVKNLDGLIEAINLLEESYKNNLIINWFGAKDIESDYYHQALYKIEDYNLKEIINLYDTTDNIQQEYRKSDFVALLSHYEGFPNVICEAMTMSKPIIASKVSDIPIFVIENVNGYLCESNNTESITKSFIKAIDSNNIQRREMGLNNYKLALEKFDKNRIIDKYLELLQKR